MPPPTAPLPLEGAGRSSDHRCGKDPDPGAGSATQMQTSEEHISARDGAEEEFDPAGRPSSPSKAKACIAGVLRNH